MKPLAFGVGVCYFTFLPLVHPSPVRAGADFCHTTVAGEYQCLYSVWGPRNNRGINFSSDGSTYNIRVNCYYRDYAADSIVGIACWSYEALSKPPKDVVFSTGELARKLSSKGGFVKPSDGINMEQLKNNKPAELK